MAQAAPYIAMGLSTIGGMLSSNSASKAAAKAMNKQNIPPDVMGLRDQLVQMLSQGGSPYSDSPLYNQTGDLAGGMLNENYHQQLTGGSPMAALDYYRNQTNPAFQSQLADIGQSVQASLGARGMRQSSDVAQIWGQQAGRATQGREADLAGRYGEYQQRYQQGEALWQDFLNKIRGSEDARSQNTLNAQLGLATAYPGTPGYPPGLGQSGFGTGASSAGNMLLLQQMMGNIGGGGNQPYTGSYNFDYQGANPAYGQSDSF